MCLVVCFKGSLLQTHRHRPPQTEELFNVPANIQGVMVKMIKCDIFFFSFLCCQDLIIQLVLYSMLPQVKTPGFLSPFQLDAGKCFLKEHRGTASFMQRDVSDTEKLGMYKFPLSVHHSDCHSCHLLYSDKDWALSPCTFASMLSLISIPAPLILFFTLPQCFGVMFPIFISYTVSFFISTGYQASNLIVF